VHCNNLNVRSFCLLKQINGWNESWDNFSSKGYFYVSSIGGMIGVGVEGDGFSWGDAYKDESISFTISNIFLVGSIGLDMVDLFGNNKDEGFAFLLLEENVNFERLKERWNIKGDEHLRQVKWKKEYFDI